MQIYNLRPHHGLCTSFFVGKGYSSDFTNNMSAIIKLLNRNNPVVRLSDSYDIICKDCPHIDKDCGEDSLAAKYDNKVLQLCELRYGAELDWNSFSDIIEKKIISPGFMKQICYDCQWYSLCSKMDF